MKRILTLAVTLIACVSSKKHKQTPKALGLKNHYGSPTVENFYGPKSNPFASHVENNLHVFAPFLAENHRTVNPSIVGPKLRVTGEMEYPVHNKVPTFLGFKNELQPVEAYDRHEGNKII
jgi:hypothetical protein